MSAPFMRYDRTADDGGTVPESYVGLFGWQVGPGAGDYQGWITDRDQPWAGIGGCRGGGRRSRRSRRGAVVAPAAA